MRLKDADALLKTIQQCICDGCDKLEHLDFCEGCAVFDAYAIINHAPTIDVVPVWISVKDRLPNEKINPNTKDFEYVLCYTIFGDVRAYKYGTPLLSKLPHFWNGGVRMDECVTHWQYLPEPPKEVTP